MTYVTVWTLQRGIIHPPEPVDAATEYVLTREAIHASLERDPALTDKQWLIEEGRRHFTRKRRFAA
jgi:hypothetical protein